MKPSAIPELEQAIERGCTVPGCTHKEHNELFLVQRCHPRAGVDVRYVKGTGVVNVLCHECKQPVVDIAVALV